MGSGKKRCFGLCQMDVRAWKNTELLEKVSQIYYAALITGREISTLPKETIDYFNKMREST